MSMNKWKSSVFLIIKAQRMTLKHSLLSIFSGLCLFIPFTIIFCRKFKFLSYLYFLIKIWKNILEKDSDSSENDLKGGSNIDDCLKVNILANYLDIIQKTFKTESKFCTIEYKTKDQEKKILSRNRYFQYLRNNNFSPKYFFYFIEKGHLIQYPNIKKSNLYPFYRTNSLIHNIFRLSTFEKGELIPSIRFDSFLKLEIHNTFENLTSIDLFNKEIGKLKKIEDLFEDRKKNSENYSKIEVFSKNNQKRFIETSESNSTNQIASKISYKNTNPDISNSKGDVFEFQFISYLSEELIYISPIILKYNSIQDFDTVPDYKQKLYISLYSKKKNNYWPLSDIQNSSLKNTSTRLLCDSSPHVKKTSFKDKTSERNNILKENMSPNSKQNNIESLKKKNHKKITSDISNSHQDNPMHFIHLNYKIDEIILEKYNNKEVSKHKNNFSLKTEELSGSKINSIETNNTDSSLPETKHLTFNTIHINYSANYSNITPLSLNSLIPSPTSKYKNFKDRASSSIKINDIYKDSLRLLKEVYDDNRRRGIPPTPPPIRKRWEFVNN
ncbi:hypothetical protein PNEG_01542 [Pneumocystis murina B123]|uniref:Uncharacterized protein n=1 Tax=Pneumocystis murina (strain B123) TaxID=1069680 RepID=M7PIL7_PNEMU|nr:hypothetical protein PNEG_01542 [Pneumocystis murina B123]EMR10279.1 hypothetical protein PNEG_01542 [Pneumocystis murina B123]